MQRAEWSYFICNFVFLSILRDSQFHNPLHLPLLLLTLIISPLHSLSFLIIFWAVICVDIVPHFHRVPFTTFFSTTFVTVSFLSILSPLWFCVVILSRTFTMLFVTYVWRLVIILHLPALVPVATPFDSFYTYFPSLPAIYYSAWSYCSAFYSFL